MEKHEIEVRYRAARQDDALRGHDSTNIVERLRAKAAAANVTVDWSDLDRQADEFVTAQRAMRAEIAAAGGPLAYALTKMRAGA